MKKRTVSLLKIPQVLLLGILIVSIIPVAAWPAVMKQIQVSSNPPALKIYITGEVPVKVIQVEKKELVVAMKNITLAKGFRISQAEASSIGDVSVEHLPGGVTAIVLTGPHPYEKVESGFDGSDSSYRVNLSIPALGKVKKTAASSSEAEKAVVTPEIEIQTPSAPEPAKTAGQQPSQTEIKPPQTAEKPSISSNAGTVTINEVLKSKDTLDITKPKKQDEPKAEEKKAVIPEPVAYIPPKREKGKFNGDISDFVTLMDDSGCNEPEFANTLSLVRKNRLKEAFSFLEQLPGRTDPSCTEAAFYLKGYVAYNQAPENDFAQLLKAQAYLQDALVEYPSSAYKPFGYAAMGLIQKQLNNPAAAEGYFNLVKQEHPAYPGMPEIIYHLAGIYGDNGYQDKSLEYYQKVFEDKTENSYIADAGIGYGRALFDKKQYLDALSVLNYVTDTYPKKVYESQTLLSVIGNANFEIGQSRAAREALTRVVNLYPDIKKPDVILSRVGDTYGMENDPEKAVKVYELVREKFPDSEGYVSASIGIARYLKTDEEKIEIYSMIKERFPDDTYAKIAMMRLAEIYQANKEYDKCIKEIEDLLSTHPRGLRYEAVRLMQKAYEALFHNQLKSDEYTKTLNRYELDYTKIDRMGSREISFSVGMAYLQAGLYEEAFNHLLTAYKLYKRRDRSAELLYGLGQAMDESGRHEDALKLFAAFVKQFPKDKNHIDALTRSGRIYFEKKDYDRASAKYTRAYRDSKDSLQKGEILLLHAAVKEKKDDLKTASDLQERAVQQIALAKGNHFGMLAEAYKDLGRIYMQRKIFVKAADAYKKALDLSEDDGVRANIGFLLGDAYQKGNVLPKAKKAFKQVADLSDSVWARMAEQRLATLDLAQIAQNS